MVIIYNFGSLKVCLMKGLMLILHLIRVLSQNYYGTKTRVEFNGNCLKQDKVTYNHGTMVNRYIVCEISKNYNIRSYPTLENCLFGAVSLTKNVDIDQYKYTGFGIVFDRKREFRFGNGFGRKCIIFGADFSSSSHANNKKNNILVLGKDFTQGINSTTIYAGGLYKINFTENNKKICLSLHYNEAKSYLFVNGTEIIKFNVKGTEIVATPLCLGNISKDFSVCNMKRKTGSNGYIYHFSVDYDAITVDDILDIYKYLMEKNGIVKNVWAC